MTSGFATITSAASLSPKTKTLSIICCSPTSISPSRVERETSMRSSASERTSRSAPGGSTPKTRSTASVEPCSTQMSGCETVKNARTGADDPERRPLRVAERDALRHELAEHDMEEREDEVRERDRERGRRATGRTRCVSTCSPRAPMASEVSVTPSCMAAMKRGGSPVMRSTSRARRLP